jgi:hypothetical protein
MTFKDLKKALSENGEIRAYFLKWPDNIFWQEQNSKQKLESHQKNLPVLLGRSLNLLKA